jgi:hypothetical protein
MQNIEDMTYSDLINECTGYAITKLGEGEKLHSIISFIIHITIMWKEKHGTPDKS